MGIENFEKYQLTFGPTVIEYLPRLSKELGNKVNIYSKREDCNSSLAFGGNKLRKLEYIVPDILKEKADTLVTIGGIQSNHTRMVAAVAAKLGLKAVLVQEKWVPHYDVSYDRVGNILLSRLMGAETKIVNDGFDIGIRKSWEEAIEDVKKNGGKPYPIPAGASMHKYGGLGYVDFIKEVCEQEKELGIKFDHIIVCVVTGSTFAGMFVGMAMENRANHLIGIDASGTIAQTKKQVMEIVHNTAKLVGLKNINEEINILPDYAYPAYGIPSDETLSAMRLGARTEAMITDPVYEGKSLQGMIDLINKDYFKKGDNILFAHLGGAVANNGYGYYLKDG